MDILAELTQLKADYAAAQTLLDDAKNAQTAFDAKLAEKDKTISDKEAALVAANDLVAAKDKELAKQAEAFTALQAELTEAKASHKTAEEQAVDMVASAGVKPMKADTKTETTPTKAEAIAKYASIKNPKERAEFYAANKAVLFGK